MLSLLRRRLHHAIDRWRTSAAVSARKQTASIGEERALEDLSAQAVPIKRVGNATSRLYASAIAHQLAASPDQAATIAAQLVEALKQDLAKHQEPLVQGMTVHATATGFIHFAISDRAIAAWLNLLLANETTQPPLLITPAGEADRQRMRHATALFEVQHAHARCCSLLRLAHHEALIHLDGLEAAPQSWRFRSPAQLPWLSSTHQLCFQHPVDRALLAQLLDAHDHLFDPFQRQTQASVLRSAQAVAQAFQACHRAHPLWEKPQEDSSITLARLGLLMITQRVLHLLLWNGLNLCPAVEL